MVLIPRTVDLGGFQVGRILPAREKRMVGPFVFWDQMGRSEFISGKGVDVKAIDVVPYLIQNSNGIKVFRS